MKRFLRTLLILMVAVMLAFVLLLAGIEAFGHLQQVSHADIICVFGAAVWGDAPSPELEARLLWAIQLYQEGRAPLLFLSGGPTGSSLTESDVMGAFARAHGVPYSALILDNAGITTASTVANLKRYMDGNSLKTCLMVSSPFHMARIMILARLNGLSAFTDPPAQTPITLNGQERLKSLVRETFAMIKDLVVAAIPPSQPQQP
jgi:vancomycin permeability regulator SanA